MERKGREERLKVLLKRHLPQCILSCSRKWRKYRRNAVNVRRFIEFLNREHPEVCVSLLDVGARGGLEAVPLFEPLLRLKNRVIHGIEPDKEEAERLKKSGAYDRVFTDGVAWYNGEAVLHVPNVWCASIRKINTPVAQALGLLERGRYSADIPVRVKNLGDILPTGMTYDFIKTDVEGCDYDALTSADPVLLEKALCITCETQGVPLYEGQHVTAELCDFMKQRGFILYSLKTQESSFHLYDAVWVKDPQFISDPATVFKYCLLGALLKEKSFILNVLRTYERNHGKREALDIVYKMIGIKK